MNTTDLKPLPARPNIEQYRKQAKELLKSGDSERIAKNHPHPPAEPKLADAQLVIAREHGFESWPKFTKVIAQLNLNNSAFSKFEQAAEAIISGDADTLKALLRENPELIHARSERVHRAELLHYVSANGFEGYRQKTPKNAVEIATILLNAGADVNAIADCYGTSTALTLVATSVHPKQAGVQIELMELLLERGAVIDGVNAALANGRREAAEFLADRGASLDLEGASGVGRLDAVRKLFPDSTREKKNAGFSWACEYGRYDVVDFLLSNGVTGDEKMPGLHWAIVGGHLDTVRLLVDRGASLVTRNDHGATALGTALWVAVNGDPVVDYLPTIEALLDRGAEVRSGTLEWLAEEPKGNSQTKSKIAELLRRRLAKA